MGQFLLVAALLLTTAALPVFPYSRRWGFGPAGRLAGLTVLLLLLVSLGVLPWGRPAGQAGP